LIEQVINFFNEDIVLPKLPFPSIKKWIKTIIATFDCKAGDISFIFCSDDYLLNINQSFLKHDYFTDIITFNYNSDKLISGDIFISVETVRLNAVEFNVSEQDEFLRVIIHGILHLLGFNDQIENETKEMRRQENLAIEKFKSSF
jgi:probable rRNA maturation factor